MTRQVHPPTFRTTHSRRFQRFPIQGGSMSLYGPRQLADSMRTVRKNTILIAEDIPEKDYGYRPTPESRSVAETLLHIASLEQFDRFIHEEKHLSSLEGFDFGALIKKSEIEEKRPRSKAEIIALLLAE